VWKSLWPDPKSEPDEETQSEMRTEALLWRRAGEPRNRKPAAAEEKSAAKRAEEGRHELLLLLLLLCICILRICRCGCGWQAASRQGNGKAGKKKTSCRRSSTTRSVLRHALSSRSSGQHQRSLPPYPPDTLYIAWRKKYRLP